MSMPNKSYSNSAKFEKLPKTLAITNARIVDPATNLDFVKTVIIQNNKISDILDHLPDSFKGEQLSAEDCVPHARLV